MYFSYFMQLDDPSSLEGIGKALTAILIVITTGYFEYLEYLQVEDKGSSQYFSELTNYVDNGSAILNLFLIVWPTNEDSFYNFSMQQKLAAVAISFVWYKTFYWMRLFDSTAFFINLLTATFTDIQAFVIMMLLLILGVSNVMLILNLNEQEDDLSPRAAYSDDTSSNFLNSVIWSYKLGLGEFDTDGFAGENELWLWMIWLMATFLL